MTDGTVVTDVLEQASSEAPKQDIYDELVSGPNTVTKHMDSDGRVFYSRTGTFAEANKIEAAFRNTAMPMNGVLFVCFFLLCKPDGTPRWQANEWKKFQEDINVKLAIRMAHIIRKEDDEPDEDNILPDFGLDDAIVKIKKKSRRTRKSST